MNVGEILKGCGKWIPPKNYQTETPVVSVLLPTFRRAQSGLFSEAVEPVLNQSYQNLELIVIDDASTDGTEDLIAAFMRRDPRVGTIRLDFQYEEGSAGMGVFEDAKKQTFLYRLLNKLGCRLKKPDVLFTDCR